MGIMGNFLDSNFSLEVVTDSPGEHRPNQPYSQPNLTGFYMAETLWPNGTLAPHAPEPDKGRSSGDSSHRNIEN
jgi:hypothetical protein